MAKFHTYGFEKLEVYIAAKKLSVRIRPLLLNFPREERYELTSQLKRAVDSISSNLAEGSGRASTIDQAHFTNMSYTSGLEVVNHLSLALSLGYIDYDIYESLRVEVDTIQRQLNALYKYQLNRKQNLKTKTIE